MKGKEGKENILSYNKSYFYRRFRLLTLNLRKSEKHLILYRNHLSTVDPTFSIVNDVSI